MHDTTKQNNLISISGLHKSFGDKDVLRGIDLELAKGENLIVLGRSGTGKSVLIKIICGLLTQDKGSVTVLGQDVASLNQKQIRELRLKVAFSFQNSALYDSMTIRENLRFPMIRNFREMSLTDIDKRVDQVLEGIGLPEVGEQMPSELSGGQVKRIGIGRTLIVGPEIMLYDEPTAGLDPISSNEINKVIKMVQERFNVSSILITHDLTCAKHTGDRLVMILDGKVARQGTFKEVFDTQDERIRAFYDYNFTD